MLTLNEAAELLRLDPSTLRHQIANGKLQAKKVGPVWTITVREYERYRLVSHRATASGR